MNKKTLHVSSMLCAKVYEEFECYLVKQWNTLLSRFVFFTLELDPGFGRDLKNITEMSKYLHDFLGGFSFQHV